MKLFFTIAIFTIGLKVTAQQFLPNPLFSLFKKDSATFSFCKVHHTPILKTNSILIPINYYTANFGIMCKQELKLEKLTKIPFRFRLGSLDYVNKLEGKR